MNAATYGSQIVLMSMPASTSPETIAAVARFLNPGVATSATPPAHIPASTEAPVELAKLAPIQAPDKETLRDRERLVQDNALLDEKASGIDKLAEAVEERQTWLEQKEEALEHLVKQQQRLADLPVAYREGRGRCAHCGSANLAGVIFAPLQDGSAGSLEYEAQDPHIFCFRCKKLSDFAATKE